MNRADAPPAPRRRYERCNYSSKIGDQAPCGERDCPRCHPGGSVDRFLDEVRRGGDGRTLTLPPQPVLIYHVPRTGGTFLADVFERMEILVLRPDVPEDAEVTDALLRGGERRGVVIQAHTAAALKARHPDVEFLEFGACWRDPYEISASEYSGIRNARPGHHLFDHHLRDECLRCPSVSQWVEQFRRTDPISTVLGDNRPPMLRASHYADDVAAMLKLVLGREVDLVRDFGFRPETLQPGRWVRGAAREDLLRLRELHAKDYELGASLRGLAELQGC